MASAVLIGSTGLVGGRILATLLALPSVVTITTVARRDPKHTDAKLTAITDADTSTWSTKLASIASPPQIYFSALGTTRAAAGGVAQQRKIDHDLNLELAAAAKKAGSKVLVLISSNGANAASSMAYLKMKGELDDAVSALGFEHTIILKPGLLVGSREESRFVEGMFRGIAGILPNFATDFWAQDVDVIGRAAVAAGLNALDGKIEDKVLILGQLDIIRMGRTEWKA